MIPLSRFRPHVALPWRWRAMSTGGLPIWPASCSLLLVGCLYVEPTWEPAVNEPPNVLLLDPPLPDVLFDNDLERITVIADDPEGRPLAFLWDFPPFATFDEERSEIDGVSVSRVDVAWSDELLGAVIGLTIIDAPEDDDAVLLDLEWTVVTP